jgi:hypothetical protein
LAFEGFVYEVCANAFVELVVGYDDDNPVYMVLPRHKVTKKYA